MASISLAAVRTLTDITVAIASDAKLGMLIGVSNAIFQSLTSKDLGHAIESLTQSGTNVTATIYGHLLGLTGRIFISGCGPSIDGERDFKYVDDNTISILNVTLAGTESLGRLHQRRVYETHVVDQTIEVATSPIYRISEFRMATVDGPPDFTDDATIVDLSGVSIRRNGTFRSIIEVSAPLVNRYVRSRQFLNPQLVHRRRMAQVTYYSGLEGSAPLDLIQAIGSAAKEILAGGGMAGAFNSESIDYYSYSKASMQDLKDYPFSTISVFMRYA